MKHKLQWMSRPFAHRGLHNADKGIIENTRSAVAAAIARNYGIEVDLRPAACGTAMVFHDDTLERLTLSTGRVSDKTARQLQLIEFRGTNDNMMTLRELLDLVAGQTPMLLEIKSNWPFDEKRVHKFVTQIIATLEGYRGDFAIMSFDPAYLRAFRDLAPHIPRGLISESFADSRYWHMLTLQQRLSLRFLLSSPQTRPHFIAYDINALPAIAPLLARRLFGKKLATWTVRTPQQEKRARKYCDAMIFEKLRPSTGQDHSGS